MWKEYSWNHMKNNGPSNIAVMAAAFISALLLSLSGSVFYNLWNYEIRRLIASEGNWHGRITGEPAGEELERIRTFPNVEEVKIGEGEDGEIVTDICFKDKRTAFRDMGEIAQSLGIEPEKVTSHYSLLAMYLIRDPADPAPRAVFPLLLTVTVMACVSLIMIIHNAFGISMHARIRQIGILSSIGATPGQIRTCLLQEAAALCAGPVAAGTLLGILGSVGLIGMTNAIAENVPGRFRAVWTYHPLLLILTLFLTTVTIGVSAWIPARKVSALTPLEAIRNAGEPTLKKKKSSPVLSFLFGAEGELAGNALKARKKALRTASLSLTAAFLAFFVAQCFFTLTRISQEMTYFTRYQDAWDIMVSVKNTSIRDFQETQQLQSLSGIGSCIVYQRAEAKRLITQKELSRELSAAGGLAAAPDYVSSCEGGWLVNAPLVILDDQSFLEYCRQIGAEPRLDGAVILNRIDNSRDSNFRSRNYIPYINEEQETTFLQRAGDEAAGALLPVAGFTQDPPVLREAYDELDACVLVHFLSRSCWMEIGELVGGAGEDTNIRILAGKEASAAELDGLEKRVGELMHGKYDTESVNRVRDKANNDAVINGMMLVFGGFCVLLALIGIGNVFSNTLSFVTQRKREFARYLSVGLSPDGITKIFCIEALVTVGRPALASLILTGIITALMIKAAWLDPVIFIRKMPVGPIAVFVLAVFATVALAYYLGGRKVMRSSLIDALRDGNV